MKNTWTCFKVLNPKKFTVNLTPFLIKTFNKVNKNILCFVTTKNENKF